MAAERKMTIHRRSPRSKIARLPQRIREAIAVRLLDGHSQRSILAWLNRQASVRQALRREREGRATCKISANNLSRWLRNEPSKPAGVKSSLI